MTSVFEKNRTNWWFRHDGMHTHLMEDVWGIILPTPSPNYSAPKLPNAATLKVLCAATKKCLCNSEKGLQQDMSTATKSMIYITCSSKITCRPTIAYNNNFSPASDCLSLEGARLVVNPHNFIDLHLTCAIQQKGTTFRRKITVSSKDPTPHLVQGPCFKG